MKLITILTRHDHVRSEAIRTECIDTKTDKTFPFYEDDFNIRMGSREKYKMVFDALRDGYKLLGPPQVTGNHYYKWWLTR